MLNKTHAAERAKRIDPRKSQSKVTASQFRTITEIEGGDIRIGFGIMGGSNQSQAHAQFVANIVDYGMNTQEALEAGRFTKGTFGYGQAVISNGSGVHFGASEPRHDGAAIPETPPVFLPKNP